MTASYILRRSKRVKDFPALAALKPPGETQKRAPAMRRRLRPSYTHRTFCAAINLHGILCVYVDLESCTRR